MKQIKKTTFIPLLLRLHAEVVVLSLADRPVFDFFWYIYIIYMDVCEDKIKTHIHQTKTLISTFFLVLLQLQLLLSKKKKQNQFKKTKVFVGVGKNKNKLFFNHAAAAVGWIAFRFTFRVTLIAFWVTFVSFFVSEFVSFVHWSSFFIPAAPARFIATHMNIAEVLMAGWARLIKCICFYFDLLFAFSCVKKK